MIRERGEHRRAPLLATTLIPIVFALSGCAGYSTSIREAQVDLRAGRPEAALDVVNNRLSLERAEEIPHDLKKSRVLLLLERATLLQALGRYDLAARDMIAVDQRMEWLDIDGVKSVDLGKYIYSGSATPYRAPAYERMLLNTLNMLNFLAMGDMQGAKVEARRFRLLEEFFAEGPQADGTVLAQLLATGNYLGGVAFESARDYDIAIRFYGRAWAYGFRAPWFRKQLVDLGRVTGWRGRGVATTANGLEDLLIESELKGRMRVAEYRTRWIEGDVVVVVQTGLAPYKVPERLPIGAALAYSHHHHHGHSLSSEQRATANRLAVAGALKWVNFPVLTSSTSPRSVSVSVDDEPTSLAPITDVGAQVRAGWNDIAPALIGAAILRMITRAAVGGATRAGSRAYAESKDAPAIGVLGWLAGVAVEGALAAADTPDTRSWTTLPNQIHITRVRADPGRHRVAVNVNGRSESRTVDTKSTTLTIMNFSRMR